MKSISLASITDIWSLSPEFEGLTRGFRTGSRDELVVGLQGPARALLLAGCVRALGRPSLLVTTDEMRAERLKGALEVFSGHEVLLVRPERHLPYEVLAESREAEAERLRASRTFLRGGLFLAVAPLEAVLARMMPPQVVRDREIHVIPGSRISLSKLASDLVEMGYDREERVEAPGQFAVRGGILDVFDPTGEATRLEFFGEEVESVRRFDPLTQRSGEEIVDVHLGVARETIVTEAALRHALPAIRRDLQCTVVRLRQSGERELAGRLEGRIAPILEGRALAGEAASRFLPYLYPGFATILDYLPSDTLLALDDPDRLREVADQLQKESALRVTALLEEGSLLPKQGEVLAAHRRFEEKARGFQQLLFQLLFKRTASAGIGGVTALTQEGPEHFAGQWELFRKEMVKRLGEGVRLLLLAETEDRARNLATIVADEGLPARVAVGAELPGPGEALAACGEIENGFFLPTLRLWVVTEAELLGRTKRRSRPLRAREEEGRRLTSYLDLREGDYVVHVHHGIGRFVGMKTMESFGARRDYLHIAYAGDDRLFVPTDQIQLIQKYVGQEGHTPRLYRLGGGDWNRVKGRVKESVREMAAELLRLEAIRKASSGYRCGPDGPWQKQLEESFPYEETEDQIRAMVEIKGDLESGRPMDRLLLGDVGYGKTELAIRAAFKLVSEGKQVAVLVPTTILAQQHFQTFTQRMAGFPVEIDLLTRFRTPKEQATTLRRLEEGLTDIVIGTHRLLAKGIRFHDLGLLVIDEEQRFGVQHKERIKALKERVHVLTLTATPIPRTLQMGLLGMKDMSVIDTPPEGRVPVQTYVVEEDAELVKSAVERELGRGGQAFYVQNRIERIDDAYVRLKALVPEARVAVAHGQMPEERLEETMIRFLEGEEDVLLSTTIIESGLDIPNVNTLIVEDADHLGLGQMYQLRGRIGRSSRQAYAYFTYRRDRSLTEEAEKRLQAIRQFTEFGSGFKLAMRDLEIRGAGNILGPEQHGFIVAVGFDLYASLLEEAVNELKGTPAAEREYPSVDLPLDAFIPDAYIEDERQKIEVYKRIAALSNRQSVEDLGEELRERFGEMPEPVRSLLQIARIRILGEAVGVRSIRMERSRIVLTFVPGGQISEERLGEIGARYRGRAMVRTGKAPEVSLRVADDKVGDATAVIEEVLDSLTEVTETA